MDHAPCSLALNRGPRRSGGYFTNPTDFSTSLTRFFARLPHELHEPFVEAYREELLSRIGEREPYLFAFKRILMWGRR